MSYNEGNALYCVMLCGDFNIQCVDISICCNLILLHGLGLSRTFWPLQ